MLGQGGRTLSHGDQGFIAGVVGLGALGGPIAKRLATLGRVGVNSRTRRPGLEGARIVWIEGLPDLADACSVIFMVLPDYESLRAVTVGGSGLLGDGRRDLLLVNLTTISPSQAVELEREVSRLGARWVDAPVSGTVAAAESGQLLCMLGGHQEDIAKCDELVGAFAAERIYIGPTGQAPAMKLIVNLVLAATVQALGEGIAYGEALGLEPSQIVSTLARAPVASRALERKGQQMVAGDYVPRAALRILHKDMVSLKDSGQEAGLHLRTTAHLVEFMASASEAGLGEQDFAIMIEASRKERLSNS